MQRFIINQVILLGSWRGHAGYCLKFQGRVRSGGVAVQDIPFYMKRRPDSGRSHKQVYLELVGGS